MFANILTIKFFQNQFAHNNPWKKMHLTNLEKLIYRQNKTDLANKSEYTYEKKMESLSSEDDFVVLSFLENRTRKIICWVHPIMRRHPEQGEFYVLMKLIYFQYIFHLGSCLFDVSINSAKMVT